MGKKKNQREFRTQASKEPLDKLSPLIGRAVDGDMDKLDPQEKVAYTLKRLYHRNYGSVKFTHKGLREFPPVLLEFSDLCVLDLSGNQIKHIPEGIEQLSKLKVLIMKRNRLSTLPKTLHKLEKLEVLILGGNFSDGDIDEIEWPPNLKELHLSETYLRSIPQGVFKLKRLRKLWLANNTISEVSNEIAKLESLEKIYLNGNRINDLSKGLYELPKMKGLYMEGNPMRDVPIYEWKGNKWEAWRTYYRELMRGKTYNYKAKIIFLGKGEVGKTTLMERLLDPNRSKENLKQEIKQTHGIIIKSLSSLHVDLEEEQFKMEVSMWDFGGQEIQQNVHAFFLTGNSLFLLLWTGRSADDKYRYFRRWLNTISTYSSDQSRVILVQNKAYGEDGYREEIDEERLKKDYPQLKGFINISGLYGENLGETEQGLLGMIKSEILALPKVGETIPKSWEKVKLDLENKRQGEGKQYIKKTEFTEICEKYKLTDENAIGQILEWLHQIGAVVHYSDKKHALLSKWVILDPQWLTRKVYSILLNEEANIKENKGRLSGGLLSQWYERQEGNALVVLKFMIAFDLCFRLDRDEEAYIIPILLPEKAPAEASYFKQKESALWYAYHYAVMPKGIIGNFIARAYANDLIEGEDFWQYGAILRYKGATALVEFKPTSPSPYEIIEVVVTGTNGGKLLERIKDIFGQLNKNTKHQLKEYVRCTNSVKCSEQRPAEIEMGLLERITARTQKQVQCPVCFRMLDAPLLYEHKTVERKDLAVPSDLEQLDQEGIEKQKELLIKGLNTLRHAWAIETEPTQKFKYEEQIKEKEDEIANLKEKNRRSQ